MANADLGYNLGGSRLQQLLMSGGETFTEKVGNLFKGKKREMGQRKAGRLVRNSRSVPVEKVLA